MNNPYLDDFYKDMKEWAFHSQLYFLTHKFVYIWMFQSKIKTKIVVLDRSIYEDAEIFCRNLYRSKKMITEILIPIWNSTKRCKKRYNLPTL